MLKTNHRHTLGEIIESVKQDPDLGDDFCLYGEDQDELDLHGVYLIADYPDVVDDQEVYPESVRVAGLNYLYSGQQFADVVMVLMAQKPAAEHGDHVRALNFYMDNDTFLGE
ncbi:DUF7716 domain-containing protein [Pseudomonas phoenicis]|uniref:DUF7716 domain-containing protein n=1 Tax=unclassified Pseudomonas TaxID=196821 RepID=UPI00399F2284